MAVDLWSPISGSLLAGALKDLREEADECRVHAYDYRNTFFHGESGFLGSPYSSARGTIQYLTRHSAEGADAWAERQRRFSDCGITSRAAGALIASMVGHNIKREIDGSSDAVKAALAQVYADSRMASRQRMFAQNQVVCGDAVALIAWSDALQMLLIHSVDPGNFYAIAHPDDPMREAMVIERRNVEDGDKDDASIYWLWTNEQKRLVNDNGEDLDHGDGTFGWAPNPYGVIPYAHCAGLPMSESYWGRSPVAATIEIHRAANNLRSQGDRLILMQAHAQLVISDRDFNEKIRSSESNAIILSENGSAAYVSPGAAFDAVEKVYQRNIDEAFALVGMPMSIIRGGEIPSGYAMAVAFQGKAEIVADLAVEYKAFEEDILRKVCAIGSHYLPLPAECVPDVDVQVEVFPADRMAQRDADRLDWQAGAMTTEDYVTRWIVPEGASPETVAEYVAKLNAQSAQKAAQSNPFAGMGTMPPEQRPGLM